MPKQLTDAVIRAILKPETGASIVRDSKVRGLGVRILPSGTSSFILDYVIAGRRRIYTIGRTADWRIAGAREHAKELKHRIRYEGYDPAAELKADRDAMTVEELCERFKKEHTRNLRPKTVHDYERMMREEILPELGNRKAASIEFADINRLHRKITERGAPISANLCHALCSVLFNYAIELKVVSANPTKGVKRNPAHPRSRYLDKPEIAALTKALASYPDQDMADIFRLLLLTGARRGETQSATWEQFDLFEGVWTKPSSHTKQKKEHRVPLAATARALLAKRRTEAGDKLQCIEREIAKAESSARPALEEWRRRVETYVFPARRGDTGHISEVKKAWRTICSAAGIVIEDNEGNTKHGARVHDLRHTAASILVSSGASLPLIGQLLGHSQIATTQRYSHLFDDAQRAAVERLGAIVDGKPSAKVIPMKAKRRT